MYKKYQNSGIKLNLKSGKSIDLKLKLLIILQKLLYFIIFFILRR